MCKCTHVLKGSSAKRFRFKRDKMKELLLYLADKFRDDPTLTLCSLLNMAAYVDFQSYRELGKPITGATYRKRADGFTFRQWPKVIAELVADGSLEVQTEAAGA